jgi:hypothetical protein
MIRADRLRRWLPRASVGLACVGLVFLVFAANRSTACAGRSWWYGFTAAVGCFALAAIGGWTALAGPRRDPDWRFGPKLAYLGIIFWVIVLCVRLATKCGPN